MHTPGGTPICPTCGQPGRLNRHCPSAGCTWQRCGNCRLITDARGHSIGHGQETPQ